MKARLGDIECKAIYQGDVLLWAITEGGEIIDDKLWHEASTWEENSIWHE